MLSKRVFGNRSNLANLTLHIEDDHRISLKRASEEPSHLIAPKKSKAEGSKRVTRADLKNQENVTKTIERKVKSISLGKPTSVNSAKSASVTSHPSKTSTVSSEKIKEEIKEIKEEIKLAPLPEAESSLEFEFEESKEEEVASPKVDSPVIDFTNPFSYYSKPQNLPSGIDDYDSKHVLDTYSEPHYAADIFQYYRAKEVETLTTKYLSKQKEITKNMRAILVDWLVEVQQNYTLNHETLYLAVKMVDQYLMKENIKKTDFQLLGATAMLIAAKYDERIPPAIEDFVYSCDNLYKKRDLILMEMDILKKLDFNLGFPLSYRFLRRYARCADLSMEELTLARYILEMSLMDYELIEERESFISAACLLLALRMKHFPSINVWTDALAYYSGYSVDELTPLMIKLNQMISAPPKQALSSIRSKYSHRIFMEVAKISPLPKEIKQ